MAGLFDDEPRDDRPAFGERHADEHERQDFAEHAGVAAMAMTPPAVAMPMPMAAPPKARPMWTLPVGLFC